MMHLVHTNLSYAGQIVSIFLFSNIFLELLNRI